VNTRRAYLARGSVTYLHLFAHGYTHIMTDDLAKLRQDHPGWTFGSVWASAGSGPDAGRLWAYRDGVRLSAWTAAELARAIRRAEQSSS